MTVAVAVKGALEIVAEKDAVDAVDAVDETVGI